VTRRETNLIVATAAVAIASLLTAIAAVTMALIVGHRDKTKIHTLEHQVAVLCARTTVSGVTLTPGGRARVTTARGC
jgi:hypothetical protein